MSTPNAVDASPSAAKASAGGGASDSDQVLANYVTSTTVSRKPNSSPSSGNLNAGSNVSGATNGSSVNLSGTSDTHSPKSPRPKSTKNQGMNVNPAIHKTMSNRSGAAPSPNTKKPKNKNKNQNHNHATVPGSPNLALNVNAFQARFSKRRIGGPDYTNYNGGIALGKGGPNVGRNSSLHRSMVESSTDENSLGVAVTMTPANASSGMVTAQSLGRRGNTGKVPMPVDLGGRRNSKDITRERSKSSLSSGMGIGVNTNSTEIIIRYGELLKKGVVDPSWKRRFFVLTDRHLYYYAQIFDVPIEFHQIDIPPKAQIPLNVIQDVRKDKEDASGTKFNIFTPARTYRLRMETDRGADAWVGAITGACENAKQQLHPLFQGRRDSFNSIKADELDAISLNAGSFKNPMKQLRTEESLLVGKARKKGNQPHTPAAIEDFEKWSTFDVAAWLHTVNLGAYSELFYQNNVDGKKLKELSKKQEVVDLGVDDEDVMAFLNAIEQLKSNSFDEGGDE